jgi:adenine-specific DNA-methyltransferase
MNENKYYLGTNYKTDYYFYYEKVKVCELNNSFLSTLNRKNDSIIIYADTCTLGENDLNNFGIIFKKTPRDIVKI